MTAGAVKGHILHQDTKFYKGRSNRYGDIVIFVIFQDGGRRNLEFLKIRNFNDLSAVQGQCASSCQISSKSVKLLQRYSDLTVFKMATVRHLGFVKFEIFNGREQLRDPFCISEPNFVKIGQTAAEISRFFVIFKMAAAAILNFQKFKILTVEPL